MEIEEIKSELQASQRRYQKEKGKEELEHRSIKGVVSSRVQYLQVRITETSQYVKTKRNNDISK
jgi:hypothetical protein